MIGGFLSSMSLSMLTSALPSIMDYFEITATRAQLLTTGYILILGVVSAVTAYLINKYKTKNLFLWSVGIFLLGNLIAGFAPNFTILLIARIMQAMGGGILLPQIQVFALRVYPKEQKGKAMSLVGLVVAFPPALGPIFSGVFVDNLGWQSIFLFTSIMAAIVFILGICFVKDVGETYEEKLDWLSLVLYAVGFCTFMLGVTNYEDYGISLLYTIAPVVVGILCLTTFSLRQFRITKPLMELRAFRDRKFTTACILIQILYMANMLGVTLLPLYVQNARGLSATVSGLVLLPSALLTIIVTPIIGRMYDKKGPRIMTLFGIVMLLIGNSSFIFFDGKVSIVLVIVAYCFRVIGIAIIMPLMAYGLGDLREEMISHGNALISSARQMGGSVGTTILISVASLNSTRSVIDAHGINVSFAIQSIIYGAILIYAFVMIREHKIAK